MAGTKLVQKSDEWAWNSDGPKAFSVQLVKLWLRSEDSVDDMQNFEWCKWLPLKCNVFMWRACLDRIPTKVALRRRNIGNGERLCGLCQEFEESVDHLFAACRIAVEVWNGIARWVHMPNIYLFSIMDVLQAVDHSGLSKGKKEIVYGIFVLTCWRIWKARNEKVFNNISRNMAEIVSDVKSLGFLWFSCRSKNSVVDWKGWKFFNFEVM
ncbi:uncharacterized protein LOC110900423 [Helianthus annuus]|uniref:uncharacterized protein LOC110900423 n=1 Tax=Helianthus annuus TaxID=4232 RepID=UPI000B905278|nr:uncharacterized protein LOC110900423 [Helianthus annuus]